MSQPSTAPIINEDKLNAFMGKVVGDFGAALSASLAYIGQKLGLYKAIAGAGPVTAAELVEENINPIGRTFSAASTLCCTPNSLAMGGPGLGAVATEKALGDVVRAGGFPHFRRAAETPFNRVFEARRTA